MEAPVLGRAPLGRAQSGAPSGAWWRHELIRRHREPALGTGGVLRRRAQRAGHSRAPTRYQRCKSAGHTVVPNRDHRSKRAGHTVAPNRHHRDNAAGHVVPPIRRHQRGIS